MTHTDRNQGPGMGQTEKPDGVKLDNNYKIPIKNNLNHFGGGGGYFGSLWIL